MTLNDPFQYDRTKRQGETEAVYIGELEYDDRLGSQKHNKRDGIPIINDLAKSLRLLLAIANCSVSKLCLEYFIAVLTYDGGNSSWWC